MNLQTLLGSLSLQEFVADYFLRQPFTAQGGCLHVCSLGSWDVLDHILARTNVDVMVVREGRQIAGRDPHSGEAARALCDEGCTVLVRHAERHQADLASLAAAFADDFHAAVNVHIYATPPGQQGFSWHYDAEDVFILQTSGTKEYSLRKNTVHPWPLEETIPADMRYPAEIMPLMRVLLEAGDWLYIPCGWWHQATARITPPLPRYSGGEGRGEGARESQETAISLAVGVMSPAAISVHDFLRSHLVESLLWRQRLPVTGAAAALSRQELREQCRLLFAELADDLARRLRDERLVEEFIKPRPKVE
jgi:hypothetical protein